MSTTRSYAADRAWSDRYLPAIRAIVGPRLLTPASFEDDAHHATDLVVLRGRDMTIACRVRQACYAARYGWQFTIRSQRDSGAATEYEKIVDGWADWMFYGFAADDGQAIARWFLLDLAAFRAHLIRDQINRPPRIRGGTTSNGDGTYFAWFDVRSFRGVPRLVIASSHQLEYEDAA